jgi:hypothetical protein
MADAGDSVLGDTDDGGSAGDEPVSGDADVSGGDEGVEFPTWMEQNKGEFKKDERLKDFATINDLSQAYVELLEKKGVTVPDENSSDDERKAFFKQIGRPDEYEVPEEILKREEFKGLDSVYDRLNLTEEQAAGLNEFLKDSAQRLLDAETADRRKSYENAMKTARDTWGVDYDDNMKYVNRFINSFGGQALKTALQSTGADNRFPVLDAFVRVSKLLGPNYFTTGEIAPQKDEVTGLRYDSEI